MLRAISRAWAGEIKFDPHVHSLVSDGALSPDDIIIYARLVGLEVISITDHNTFLGSYIALKRGRTINGRVVIVPGAEFRTEFGDVLVLCEDVPVSSAAELKRRSRYEHYVKLSLLLELKHKENCIMVVAHPFSLVRWGGGRLFESKYLDCVEVYNSSSDPFTNIYTIYATRDSKGCKTAGSDAHVPELIGSSYTLVEADGLNSEAIIESMRKSAVKPFYNVSTDFVRNAILAGKRFTHTLRVKLGDYGDPWKRTRAYPI